ncbi:MAG: hypothetical protein DMG12_17020 [Acidobacteria bacterium]|nr:MAG: hypothetical protein DMG12_17020 [Acidobacteriota bacterium]
MLLKIEKLVYGGAGLARTEGGVVFVPRSAPGDVIEAQIVDKRKDYSIARIIEIVEPSGKSITNRPSFGKVSGGSDTSTGTSRYDR